MGDTICVISIIFLVFLNIVQIKNNSIISIRIVCFLVFIAGLRYVCYLFLLLISNKHIKILCIFYYGSMIGTHPSILALYTIPRFREKISEISLLILLSPFLIFYLYLLYLQPLEIIIKPGIGYGFRLLFPWNIFVSIYQGIFVIIVITLSTLGFRYYSFKFPRSQYLLFLLSYLLLMIDGLTILFKRINTFQPFIISEAFVLIAILYAFSTKPIKEQKRN